MNKYIFILSSIIFIALTLPSSAENPKTFTLKDGATFQGHLSSVENGTYTVESPTLGNVKLKETDVLSITSSEQPLVTPSLNVPKLANTAASQEQMQAMQAKIASDPAIMADIQALASNPQLMQALADPALLTAVAQGPQALQGNPAVEELFKDPQMQALIQKIQASQTAPSGNETP
jgi:hypothetical protein